MILREISIMSGFYVLTSFSFLLLVSFHGEAYYNINGIESESEKKVYIVYMGGLGAPRSPHAQLLSELNRREKNPVVHTYNKSFLGFAACLSDKEAKLIAQRRGVVSVFPDQAAQPQTTRSWDFLMGQNYDFETNDSTTPTSSTSRVSWSNGADTIIGIIDFGIWPEHPSFADNNMGPIPPRWKGICMFGEEFKCNRKVIGARNYADLDNSGSMGTTRDYNGHGTHVTSIAAGNYVWWASYYGLAQGTARGGSPSSRIAAYRVCGRDGACMGSAIIKAFDDAIADGVDVISISLGWRSLEKDTFIHNPILIGAFHAAEKDITVVSSGGNGGPSPGTVEMPFPWIITVAATSDDRHFEADVVLGRNMVIKAGGINFSNLNKYAIYPLVDGRSAGSNQTNVADASNCIPGSLDDDKVKGKIVLCENKVKGTKFGGLKRQGAIGMISIDDIQSQVPFKYGTSPIATVSEEDGARIRSYIESTRNALATILPTRTVIRSNKPAPVVSLFSSRGPPAYANLNLIKPDVAAPGLAILAAWPPLNDSSRAFPGKKPPLFNTYSGTSQACPHVSGLVATVKSHRPTWTHDVIRSAIMTTATQKNNLNGPITTHTGSRATPYDFGAGEINVIRPLFPGLVYETKATDYVQFLCNMGYDASIIKTIASIVPNNFSCPDNSNRDLISDMNYPSIAISGLETNGSRTVMRTLTNVGEQYAIYTATVEAPAGMDVQVVPKILRFTKTAKKLSFQVTFILTTYSQEYWFGSVTWRSRNYKVRSPFAVRRA